MTAYNRTRTGETLTGPVGIATSKATGLRYYYAKRRDFGRVTYTADSRGPVRWFGSLSEARAAAVATGTIFTVAVGG